MSGYQGQYMGARLYENTILTCLANAGCLADPENIKMRIALNFTWDSLHRTLKTLKNVFLGLSCGDPQTCVFVNRIELIIKYRKILLQKLGLMRKTKSGAWKMATISWKTLKNDNNH